MTLRWRILGILLAVLALYIGSIYAVQRLVLFPSFIELEKREARKDLDRCMEALHREIAHLDTVTHDWAAWDDTYRFVAERDPVYIQSNLLIHTFMDNRLNVLTIFDEGGERVWGNIRDLEAGALISVPELEARRLPPDHLLFQSKDAEDTVTGVMLTRHAPLILAARPITTSDHEAPIRGTLLMGRFLTDRFVQKLIDQTRVAHRYWPVNAEALPAGIAAVLRDMGPARPVRFEAVNDHWLHAYRMVPDIFGEPALLLQAELPREIRRRGQSTLAFALVSLCAAGAVILLALLALLHQSIVRPLNSLTERVGSFRTTGEAPPAIFLNRKDEIGRLCREFDHLIQKLDERHARIRSLASQLVLSEVRQRRRMAADLHDRIGQTLAISKLQVGMLARSEDAAGIRPDLEAVGEMLEGAIQEARSLMFELSPPVLNELGLGPAIRWLAERLENQYDICVHCRNEAVDIPTADRFCVLVFQAVQELMLSAAKQSGTRQVEVCLDDAEGALRIDIQGDGVGFGLDGGEGGDCEREGEGLFSIRERLAPLRGRVDVQAGPEGGFHAVLTVPKASAENLPEIEST